MLFFFSWNKKVRTCILVKSRGASISLSENIHFPPFLKSLKQNIFSEKKSGRKIFWVIKRGWQLTYLPAGGEMGDFPLKNNKKGEGLKIFRKK